MLFLFYGDNFEILRSIFLEEHTKEELQDKLKDFGLKGYITISILAMLQIVMTFLPAEPIQVIAGITFGFIRGLAACMVGVIAGNSVMYLLYKIFGDKLNAYFDKNLELDVEKAGASGKVTALVFILYFLPAIPYGMICFFAATMRMKFPKYLLVTVLGALPSVCIGVGLGHMAISASWIISALVFVILVSVLIIVMNNKDTLLKKANDYLTKAKEPYSTKTKVKAYSRKILDVLDVGARIVFFLRGVKVKYTRKVDVPEGAAIVLCNHGAFVDFAFAGTLLKKRSPNFIVNRMYFYKRSVAWILRTVGCFPKSMFTADLESMKNSMQVIKSGGVLAFMPEARLSTVGQFEDIQEGTFAFVKKMGVPVYTVKISGDYLASPKWGKGGIRRGALVEAELDILFTKEEILAASESEVKAKALERLYYDDFKWLETRPKVRYHSPRLAEGLENVLAICPECKQMHTLETKGHRIICKNCGFERKIDNRYAFKDPIPFKNFSEWYSWQYREFEKMIKENENFSLTDSVHLKSPSVTGDTLLRISGSGICTLDRTGLRFEGRKDGEPHELFFPINSIYRLLFGAGENFEIYNGKEICFFVPTDPRCAVDWYIASRIIKDETDTAPIERT
jgi:uncharacterized membrane protein YdjX (TVP38/TMEM64 family)/1-acyl-sn-glycerol-3-phosphate acyltransferase